MDQEEQANYNHFLALLRKEGTLSDEDIQELVSSWSKSSNAMVRPHIIGMFHGRLALEQIRSIRLFDKASGELVATTNKLTTLILVLTCLAVVVGIANVVATAWPYLTSWVNNGFHLHLQNVANP
jgi:hypothetical protein